MHGCMVNLCCVVGLYGWSALWIFRCIHSFVCTVHSFVCTVQQLYPVRSQWYAVRLIECLSVFIVFWFLLGNPHKGEMLGGSGGGGGRSGGVGGRRGWGKPANDLCGMLPSLGEWPTPQWKQYLSFLKGTVPITFLISCRTVMPNLKRLC